ncbi:unnamed protein product [Pylaiella littoralis]
MSSADSQQFYTADGNAQGISSAGAPNSKKDFRVLIETATARMILLEDIVKDGHARLEGQKLEHARRDEEIQKMKEDFEKELQMNDKALSDAALGVRSRDKMIKTLDRQECRHIMAMQNHHRNKHNFVAQAKMEVREEMRAEQEQRQATLDIQKMAAGHSYSSNSSNSGAAVAKDMMGRRITSSGSLFSRASTGGGTGLGAFMTGKTRRTRK